jgi:RHS repeat-associated protein
LLTIRVHAAAVALALLAPPTAGAATRTPDLTISALGAPASLTQGGTAAVSATTANRGLSNARSSTTIYVLSADRKRDAKDLLLARRAVQALKPRKRASGAVQLAIPKAARLGPAFLIACADGAGKVREANERNNCRVQAVTVVRGSTGQPGTPGGGTPLGGPTPTPAPIATPQPTPTPAPTPTPTPTPPDPGGVAPSIDKGVAESLGDATKFLYTGADAIQTGVAIGTIKPVRVDVLRGRVLDTVGAPIPAVTVTVLGHPELGQTLSRTDGRYDLAVNGGGDVTLDFTKSGLLELERTQAVPWQDYTDIDDVVMTPLDTKVTAIDPSSSAPIQVAQGSAVTDADGTRRATLMFDQGTDATMTLPNGSKQPLPALHVRATEYTVGADGAKQMPGALPSTSAYTYAAEFSVDEALAAGATDVTFDKPVVTYVDDFLGFPAGTPVPAAYFDQAKARWVPSDNGVVIKVLTVGGGTATVDVDGDGLADSGPALAALGIDSAELQKLAATYAAGKILWRVRVKHFTPWDYNWPYGCEASCPPPHNPEPPPPYCPECQAAGSIIGDVNQTLGERFAIPGTPFALHYDTSRAPGYKVDRTLRIPLTGGSVPGTLQRVDLTVQVAGQLYQKSFPPTGGLMDTFTWDGKDAYGRRVDGQQTATVSIGYVYKAVYLEPVSFQRSFAQYGNSPVGRDTARRQISVGQVYQRQLGTLSPAADGIGGWTLDVHHAYDPQGRILWRGDGTRITTEALRSQIRTVAGFDFSVSDGHRPTDAQLDDPGVVRGLAAGPDGSVYLAETSRDRVVRITPAGDVQLVAGGGDPADGLGDGGSATSARLSSPSDVAVGPGGALLISDTGNARIRRVDAGGTIRTVAGGGPAGGLGDDAPATAATLSSPRGIAAAPDGTIYVADSGHQRIRRIDPDGFIVTALGGGSPADGVGDGGRPGAAALQLPVNVALAPDGTLYVADPVAHRVRSVTSDGTVATAAGTGGPGATGDGGAATSAEVGQPYGVDVSPQGVLFIADRAHHVIRRVDRAGTIARYAGTGRSGRAGSGGAPGQAELSFPDAVAAGPDGAVYIADAGNHLVRRASSSLPGFIDAGFSIPSPDGRDVFVFDPAGRHLRTLDGVTGAVRYTFAYDAKSGGLASITDGDGNVTQIRRAVDGTPTAIVAPGGDRTLLTVDAQARLMSATVPGSGQTTLQYTADGLLSSITDPLHHTATFEYNALGRLTKDTDVLGHATTLTRTDFDDGAAVVRTSALGRATRSEFHRLADGTTRTLVTGPSGAVAQGVDHPDGTNTIIAPDGTTATVTSGPDARWGMLAPIDARVSVTTPGGRTRTETRTSEASLTDPADIFSIGHLTYGLTRNSDTTTVDYDGATHIATLTSPTGRTQTTTFDSQSRAIKRTLAGAANDIAIEYDAHGQLHKITQGSRFDTFAYADAAHPHRLTSRADALGHATSYGYDAAGDISSIVQPGGETVGFTHDAARRNSGIVMPKGTTWALDRSALGQITGITPPGAGAPAYSKTYDADRGPATFTRPDGRPATAIYDAGGRLASVTTTDGATTEAQTELHYGDATDRVTEAIRRVDGRTDDRRETRDGSLLTKLVTGPEGADPVATFEYGYDGAYDLTSAKLTAGATTVTTGYTHDGDGLTTGYGPFTLDRFGPGGAPTSIGDGTLALGLTYNGFAEVASRTFTVGGTERYKAELTRDAAGRLASKKETIGGTSHTYDYGFDANGRLTTVRRDGSPIETYGYDANGNRILARGDTASYTPQDVLQSAAYSFDAAGNMTQRGADTFRFSAAGELMSATRAGATATYVYDTVGRRTARIEGGQRTSYLYGDPRRPDLVTAGIAPDGIVTTYYYDVENRLFAYQRGASRFYVATDEVGTPRVVTDAAGTVVLTREYDAYGHITGDSNQSFDLPIGFAGGLVDSLTGLVRFGVRDYDPEAGRFSTRDPDFQSGGLNLFEYAGGDPLDARDPTGRDWSWQGTKDFASSHWQTAADWASKAIGDNPVTRGWKQFKDWKDKLNKAQELADEGLKVNESLNEPDGPHQAKGLMKCLLRNLHRIVPIDLVGTDAAEAVLDEGAKHMENQHYEGTINQGDANQLHYLMQPGEGLQ